MSKPLEPEIVTDDDDDGEGEDSDDGSDIDALWEAVSRIAEATGVDISDLVEEE